MGVRKMCPSSNLQHFLGDKISNWCTSVSPAYCISITAWECDQQNGFEKFQNFLTISRYNHKIYCEIYLYIYFKNKHFFRSSHHMCYYYIILECFTCNYMSWLSIFLVSDVCGWTTLRIDLFKHLNTHTDVGEWVFILKTSDTCSSSYFLSPVQLNGYHVTFYYPHHGWTLDSFWNLLFILSENPLSSLWIFDLPYADRPNTFYSKQHVFF